MFLYGPRSDSAALSSGDWQMPLANMQNRDLFRVARSADLDLSSTRFGVDLGGVFSFRAIVIGPTNLTTAHKYRIRNYQGSAFGTVGYDSGWVENQQQFPYGSLPFGSPYWYTGLMPWDDPERGAWIIHIFDQEVAGRFWSVEIDDQNNPDGFVDIGRLFMPHHCIPSFNYSYDGNGLSFDNNSLQSNTLAGGRKFWRRANPRVFRLGFEYLEESELYGPIYEMIRQAGYDGEVFVIPDPTDDFRQMQRRAFLGTLNPDAISQTVPFRGNVAFEIREII